MFKSAVVKLTAWYVGALVLVCFMFSLPLYNIASTRLRRGAEMQTDIVRRLPEPFYNDDFIPQLEQQRERQLSKDRQELLLTFIITDGIIIILGGAAGYLFARRTLQPIQDAHEAQATFTANASHELRTPLAVMQTEIEVALRNKKLSAAEARDILASSLEEVERLRSLSDQLLGLTRADQPLRLQKVNLSRFVTAAVKELSKRHNVSIATAITKDVEAQVDKVLLGQALGILVDNAVNYSGEKPEILVGLAKSEDRIHLTVHDNGLGISTQDIERIFERFYRGSNATSVKPSGHGLGLSLAKDIVTRHGGSITVQSSKKTGTTFTISIAPLV